MKVRITDHFGSSVAELVEFVENRVIDDGATGLVEEMEHTQGNIVHLLAVLIDCLVKGKILDAKDVKRMLQTYEELEVMSEGRYDESSNCRD